MAATLFSRFRARPESLRRGNGERQNDLAQAILVGGVRAVDVCFGAFGFVLKKCGAFLGLIAVEASAEAAIELLIWIVAVFLEML